MDRYNLIPELKVFELELGEEETPLGWAGCNGNFSLAVAYASLVWPAFTEVRGMVLRGEAGEPDVDRWLADAHHDRKAVEAMLNHLHLLDIQTPGNWGDATESQLRFIGQTLQASWSAKLARDYPGREFDVEFLHGTAQDMRGYQVFFYERREPGDA